MNSFERLLTVIIMLCSLVLALVHTIKGNVAMPLWLLFIITFILFRLAYKDAE